jgi:1-acyl-sn-glycerol-3-phosphate acyltransferase
MYKTVMPVFFFVLGFGNPKKKLYSIYDFLADYSPTQDTTTAPIIVSNHSSFLDVFYYWMDNTSFFAKSFVSKLPLMGRQCTAR